MKWFAGCLLSTLLFMGICNTSDAASLNGTADVKYQTEHYVFRDQDTVQGFVDLRKGFTIIPATNHGSNIFMDTNVTVSGSIDLRGTSTLTLLRNLYLDEGVTFSDSGRIYSYGNALVMKGDLTIPADKVLHCGGNLIINGEGHTLHLDSGSQLFLDNYATVTLRNIIVQTTHTYPGQPALNISSSMSKLVLDNVMLSLGDDFYVNRGQLFFHNDVVITGTSALVYRSIAPSYIASHGSLMFDNGTTFSYAPATDNKDLIVLSDASSMLALNGCSFKTTHTGLRLSRGRLCFDDKVMLNSQADEVINATISASLVGNASTGDPSFPRSCTWSPDGKYVAVVNYNSDCLQIFVVSNGTPIQIGSDIATGDSPAFCSWSPDGKYIAVINAGTSNTLQVFAVTGGITTESWSFSTGNGPMNCLWSPDGKYIVVARWNGDGLLKVFSFSGSTPRLAAYISAGTSQTSCSWSPDGKYIAVTNAGSSNNLRIFSFSSETLAQLGGVVATDSTGPYCCSWSPDGNFIVVSNYDGRTLQIFSFAGTTPVSEKSISTGTSDYIPWSCAWCSDGRYVAVVNMTAGKLQIYDVAGGNTIRKIGEDISAGDAPYSCSWSPDRRYIAITAANSKAINIFRVNYRPDTSSQPMERSIIWGNSAAGSVYNLDVHALAGAQVEINGNVFDDPA